jgi:hypothetical protein
MEDCPTTRGAGNMVSIVLGGPIASGKEGTPEWMRRN